MTPATVTDQELTLAFQSGEFDAYDAIHERYSVRVQALCRRMLGNEHDAQEAAQETFVRVYQALGRFNGRYQLGAWIVRIATNVCLDQLRSRRRNPSDCIADEFLELEPCPSPHGDPEAVTMRRSEGRRVRRVLASMPPMHRAALVLRDFEGFSYSEIATALQISDVQVKALIHRARQRFKRQWSSSGFAALLPWKLLQRFRDPDVAARDQVAQVASSWSPAAVSCSTALQSCGHFVGERMAAAITVALVGGVAAVGGAAQSPASAPSAPTHEVMQTAASSGSTEVLGTQAINKQKRPPEETVAGGTTAPADQTGTATVPPPSEDPAPVASPTPQPTTSPAPTPKPSPSQSPAAQPTPAPPAFTPSLAVGAFGSGQMEPRAHSYSIYCAGRSFSQRLETSIHMNDGWSPAILEIVMSGHNPYVVLDVVVSGHHYRYRSWGQHPTAAWGLAEDGDASLSISGSYGAEYGAHPEDVGLPRSGAFSAELTLECDNPSVITEGVVFQE